MVFSLGFNAQGNKHKPMSPAEMNFIAAALGTDEAPSRQSENVSADGAVTVKRHGTQRKRRSLSGCPLREKLKTTSQRLGLHRGDQPQFTLNFLNP
jgi:hypothetical protein